MSVPKIHKKPVSSSAATIDRSAVGTMTKVVPTEVGAVAVAVVVGRLAVFVVPCVFVVARVVWVVARMVARVVTRVVRVVTGVGVVVALVEAVVVVAFVVVVNTTTGPCPIWAWHTLLWPQQHSWPFVILPGDLAQLPAPLRAKLQLRLRRSMLEGVASEEGTTVSHVWPRSSSKTRRV